MRSITIQPRGPFDLATARDFASGFSAGIGAHPVGGDAIQMTFPVEGWTTSAVVELGQTAGGSLQGTVFGDGDIDTIRQQAARSLSLDHDGSGWPDVGRLDPMIGALQERYGFLRPVCFYSAWEAATSFVIGQRISMVQARRIKENLSAAVGDVVEVTAADGEPHAIRPFPRPQRLLELKDVPGLAAMKVERLHGLAEAALDGRLDTERLRSLPEDEALTQLKTLPGIGEWTASAVLLRGCDVADGLPLGDGISREAVRHFAGLDALPDDDTWRTIADRWRPYRMWATVLLHMAWRREQTTTPSYRQGRAHAAR